MKTLRSILAISLLSVLALGCKPKKTTPPADPMPQGVVQSQARLKVIEENLRMQLNTIGRTGTMSGGYARAVVVTGFLVDGNENPEVIFNPKEYIDSPIYLSLMNLVDETQDEIKAALADIKDQDEKRKNDIKALLNQAANELAILRAAAQDVYVWKVRNEKAGVLIEDELTYKISSALEGSVTFPTDAAGDVSVLAACESDSCGNSALSLRSPGLGNVMQSSGSLVRSATELNLRLAARNGYLLSLSPSGSSSVAKATVTVKQKMFFPGNFRYLSQQDVEDAEQGILLAHEAAHTIQQRAARRLSQPESFPGQHGLDHLLIRTLQNDVNISSFVGELKAGVLAPSNTVVSIRAFNKLHRLSRGRLAKILEEAGLEEGLEARLKSHHEMQMNAIRNLK